MFDNLLEALYNKVFVNIVVKRSVTDVYIEICSKKGVIENVKESFDTIVLSAQLVAFINSYTKESPYFYISLLDISAEQGALPTCEKNRLEFYKNISASEHKCHNKRWTYYTSKSDLYAMEKRYEKIGVDLVFSPFSLLNHFFEDKISTTMAMYILVQDSFISLAIFDNSELLYAQHLDMQTSNEAENEILASIEEEDEEVDLDIEQSINLEDIDVVDDVMQDLDDFGDIEDLDSIEDIDEFSEDKDLEEELADAAEELESEEQATSSFNEDYQRFSLIQTSLSHFYNDEKYDSQFVETVYIADGVGVSSDLKSYLEEEMFLNVYLRKMDINMEMCELAKSEIQ
ncbi:MAG: hypothetical protein Q9M34_11235 [Sulfurimonas sp.]|nr:hypothetical protein [Sulfurimonas sp.]